MARKVKNAKTANTYITKPFLESVITSATFGVIPMGQAQTIESAGTRVQSTQRLDRWLTLREGEAYSCTLASNRELFLFKEDDGTWTLWWGQWHKDFGPKPVSEKTLVAGLSFEQALKRGNSYLEWWFEKRTRKQKGKGRE